MDLDATTILAIYGAALSTMLAAIEIYKFRVEQAEKKPKINVTITTGFLARGNETGPATLTLTAANVGRLPVTLTSIPSLLLPDGQKIILTEAEKDVDFPHDLLPGKSSHCWRDLKELARSLKRHGYSGSLNVIAEFGDATDNKYNSQPFTLDIEDWAKT